MTIQDYLDGTRLPLEGEGVTDAMESAYNRLYKQVLDASGGMKGETLPDLKLVRSLNKNCQLITIGKASSLVYDQYLAQTVSELNRIFLLATSPDDAKAFMFRIAAEAAECCGKSDLALWFASLYSNAYHNAHEYKSQETPEQRDRRHSITVIGECYVLAHELAHHFWREGAIDHDIVNFLVGSLDTEPNLDDESLEARVNAYLDDLSFQYHGKAIPHAENIRTEDERMGDEHIRRSLKEDFRRSSLKRGEENRALLADPFFREEVFADYLAFLLCIRLFDVKIELETIMIAVQLVLENLTTIAAAVQHAEGLMGFEVFNHDFVINTRKQLVRHYLEDEYDSRENNQETGRTGHQITTETNVRYMRFVRDPITIDVASRFKQEMVLDTDVLSRFRSQLVSRWGSDITPQTMIREKKFRMAQSA